MAFPPPIPYPTQQVAPVPRCSPIYTHDGICDSTWTPTTTTLDQATPLQREIYDMAERSEDPSHYSNRLRAMQDTHAVPSARSPELQQLSCVTCRRRKVKCNRRDPCSNCVKTGIACVFPASARKFERASKPPKIDVIDRLKRLEDMVKNIQHPIFPETTSPPMDTAGNGIVTAFEKCPFLDTDPRVARQKHGSPEEFGRLMVDNGCSRYISNRLWASLSDQIDELHDLLVPSSSHIDEYLSPDNVHYGHQHYDCFLFGFNSVAHTLDNYHPHPEQLVSLWDNYHRNVAPLLMFIHAETIKEVFLKFHVGPKSLDSDSECLLFAVYFSASVSMGTDQCVLELGDTKEAITSHFRFATEQAFVRAELTSSKSLMLVQAAVLYLKSLRALEQMRAVWTMTSIVIRLATGLGLHRDGSAFNLQPFDVEMRRRLWWSICILDIQTAEDQGTDPMLHDVLYDTQLPLNINDEEIRPGMKDMPRANAGHTSLTYFLLQCEVALATRRLTYYLPGNPCSALQTIEERQALLQDLDRRLNERYVRHLDTTNPLHWACSKLVDTAVAKLSLIIYQPLDKTQSIASLPQDIQSRLLLKAVEVIELAHLFQTDIRIVRWKWELQAHTPWYAVAYVLAELCNSRDSWEMERAWSSVSKIVKDWQVHAFRQNRPLWRPLSRLMMRAASCLDNQKEDATQPGITLDDSVSRKQLSDPVNSIFAADASSYFNQPSDETQPQNTVTPYFGMIPHMGLEESSEIFGEFDPLHPDLWSCGLPM
ncbi:putative transcriptional regulatory protein [Penicillium chrysogenum]|uniref:Putative transcriptional regulatory protein n=1 Tax=Penicillium chrysogenum TaxID=5076 RepID=A0A167Y9Q3_PENCH|nr:putative transcriptional regulatory protein [Penicillium chrysogenum]